MIQFSSNDKSVNISAGDVIWYDTGAVTLLFKRSSQDCESDFEDVDEIKCNQLGFCGPSAPLGENLSLGTDIRTSEKD